MGARATPEAFFVDENCVNRRGPDRPRNTRGALRALGGLSAASLQSKRAAAWCNESAHGARVVAEKRYRR
jgi:hypothetical protein